MPPVAPQSSRSGLITWLVVFCILFVTATIFAIVYGVEASRLEKKYADDIKKTIPEYVTEAQLTDPRVDALRNLRGADGSPYTQNMSVLDIAMAQTELLASAITGANGAKASDAQKATADVLAETSKSLQPLGVPLPSTSGNLVAAVRSLAAAVVGRQQQVAELQKQVEKIQSDLKVATDGFQKALTERDQQIAQIRQNTDQSVQGAATDRTGLQAQIVEIQKAHEEALKLAHDSVNQKDVELATARRQIDQLNKDLTAIRSKLAGLRVDPNNAILRRADGTIVRLGANNIVYISRGAGDQIAPGMTFEVYDKGEGVPPVSEGLEEGTLPAGKASIEVIRVGQTSSEARIIRQRSGLTLTEGDLIANLVYDPNTKYSFVVHGKFDLDQNKVATSQDADVIKRLITQWGGQIADDVNVNTDFVVLGAEPEVLILTPEEEQDPIMQQRKAASQAEADAYADVRQKARDLHIPVLNQNRFLYLVGYYDQATR